MSEKLKSVDPSICYRFLYPSVPVLIASNLEDKTSSMLAVSIVILSNKPALIGISISQKHTTYKIIKHSKRFTVSLFDEKYKILLERLSKLHGYQIKNKLRASGFHETISPNINSTMPTEAEAVLECKLMRDYNIGDHRFLVAEVIAAFASNDFDEYWKFEKYHPVLYAGSIIGFKPRMKL